MAKRDKEKNSGREEPRRRKRDEAEELDWEALRDEEGQQEAEDGLQAWPEDELLTGSEYNRRVASGGGDDLPAEYEEGPQVQDSLSLAPEDLGRHALEEATQTPFPLSERQSRFLPEPEWPEPWTGERRTRELAPGQEGEDRLISRMSERSEHERAVSQKARQQVRPRRRQRPRR